MQKNTHNKRTPNPHYFRKRSPAYWRKHEYAAQLPIRMQTKIRIQARQRLWDIKYCLVLNYYQKKSAIISGIYRIKRVFQQIPYAQKGIRAQKSSDAFNSYHLYYSTR